MTVDCLELVLLDFGGPGNLLSVHPPSPRMRARIEPHRPLTWTSNPVVLTALWRFEPSVLWLIFGDMSIGSVLFSLVVPWSSPSEHLQFLRDCMLKVPPFTSYFAIHDGEKNSGLFSLPVSTWGFYWSESLRKNSEAFLGFFPEKKPLRYPEGKWYLHWKDSLDWSCWIRDARRWSESL